MAPHGRSQTVRISGILPPEHYQTQVQEVEHEPGEVLVPAYGPIEYHGQWPSFTKNTDRYMVISLSVSGLALALFVVITRALRQTPWDSLERGTVYYTYVTWWLLMFLFFMLLVASTYPFKSATPGAEWYRRNKWAAFTITWVLVPCWWFVWGVFWVGSGLATYAAYDIIRMNEDLPKNFWLTFLNERIVHVFNVIIMLKTVFSVAPAARYALWQQYMWLKAQLDLPRATHTVLWWTWHAYVLPQFLPMIYLAIYDVEEVYDVKTGIEPRAWRSFLMYLILCALGVVATVPLLYYFTHSPALPNVELVHEAVHLKPVDDWNFSRSAMNAMTRRVNAHHARIIDKD